MAVTLAANTDYYDRTANLPLSTLLTVCAWFYPTSFPDFAAWFYLDISGTGNDPQMYSGPNPPNTIHVGGGSDTIIATENLQDKWWFFAMSVNGSGTNAITGYYRAATSAALTSGTCNGQSGTTAKLLWGNDVTLTSGVRGRVAAFKLWDAALTADEVLRESHYYRAIRRANLSMETPAFGISEDEVDYSGNGRDWTVHGSLATSDGPPILWAPRGPKPVNRTSAAPAVTYAPRLRGVTAPNLRWG